MEQYEKDNLGIEVPPKVITTDINDRNIDLTDPVNFPTIDGLIFGFPCNDFSNVGEKLGFKGKFGPLYSYGVELMIHCCFQKHCRSLIYVFTNIHKKDISSRKSDSLGLSKFVKYP